MSRSANAEVAVGLYRGLNEQYRWTAATAWQGIARLLLTCELWMRGWEPFRGVVVYRESNDFKTGTKGPNAVLRRAGALTDYLAGQLGVASRDLCSQVGVYWRQPVICSLQPHNLFGHAFRSLVVDILQTFGDPRLTYDEEVDPHQEFPGHEFKTRSKEPRVDIVARKGGKPIALMSTRWRFRHDRVDVVDEALAYGTVARRHYPNCGFYAVIGEFAPNRLDKILSNCPPAHPHPPISAAVHFAPQLITEGLGENGRLKHLKSLEWLIQQTYGW